MTLRMWVYMAAAALTGSLLSCVSFVKKGGLKKNNALFIVLAVVVLIFGLFIAQWAFTRKNALEVTVDGNVIGIIREKNTTAEEIYSISVEKLKAQTGASDVRVNETVEVRLVRAKKNDIITLDRLYTQVYTAYTYKVEAAVITVDGAEVCVLASINEADGILDSLKNVYYQEGLNITDVYFVRDVAAVTKFVGEAEIQDKEAVYAVLSANKDEELLYTIKEGDTLSRISANYDISLEDIYKLNPELTPTTLLRIGQALTLKVAVPLLSVETKERTAYSQPIPKPVLIEENPNEYKTFSRIKQQGKDGQEDVTADIIRVNGEEVRRDIIERTTTAEPVTEIKEVGTGQTPPKRAVGTFIMPSKGRLTERFGARAGRHKGIDLANSKGTAIYASDGGTVLSAGYNGGYGNQVVINHGNGFRTSYAHCSQILVKKGQKVAQGELIARMGSTGNSTGNHLHFELHKNGVAVNPYNYVK